MIKYLLYFVIYLLWIPAFYSQTQNLVTINFSNIHNNIGLLRLGIYIDNKSFMEESPMQVKSFKKDQVLNGKIIVDFYLPKGVYGIAMLDDENTNGEMDYIFFLPQEGYGFSNLYHTGLKRPHFDDFKFEVNEVDKTAVSIKVKYL